eukprot:gene21635-21584_t
MLEKGNRNKMLRELPELHEEAFSKIDCLQLLRIKEGELVERYLKLDNEGDY